VFDPLPRQGPGDDEQTGRALARMTELPEAARILDVGCGSGAQTIALALRTGCEITALDNHSPYLRAVRDRAVRAGVADRVRCVEGDMNDLRFEAGSFDAIWCEGAIYFAGFERGLREWRRLLVPEGYLAATHVSWLTDRPSAENLRFWDAEYPDIASVETNRRIAREAGYRVLDAFPLPESAWWDDYYRPLEGSLPALRSSHAGEPEALAFLDSVQREIDLYRRYSDEYGYVFYVLRRTET
jgi:ubiquinone/menaquinone biosynthesis C-methylase UbiE